MGGFVHAVCSMQHSGRLMKNHFTFSVGQQGMRGLCQSAESLLCHGGSTLITQRGLAMGPSGRSSLPLFTRLSCPCCASHSRVLGLASLTQCSSEHHRVYRSCRQFNRSLACQIAVGGLTLGLHRPLRSLLQMPAGRQLCEGALLPEGLQCSAQAGFTSMCLLCCRCLLAGMTWKFQSLL